MTDRRVVIVNSTAQVGGAELSLLPVAAELGRTATVIALLPGHGPLEDRLRSLNIETAPGFRLRGVLSDVSGSYTGGGGMRLAAAASRQQVALAMALARLRPDVVYMNGFRAQVGATAPARLIGARVVWHVRDFCRPGMLGRVWQRLAPAASLVIANSKATAWQPGLSRVKRPPAIIYNGVDRAMFRPRPREPDGPPVIGMAGHFTPWKGHERFLRLLADLRRSLPDVTARIAGAPIYDTAGHSDFSQQMLATVEQLGLRDVVTIDSLAPESMPAWYESLHLLVHCPERPEPFGRVLAEAMAVGVGVVTSGGGGAEEVVGTAGVVVPPGDDGGLLDAVTRLLRDPEERRRFATAGPPRVEECFDEDDYAVRVGTLISTLT